MLVCAACGGRRDDFRFCRVCSELFCLECRPKPDSACPQCGRPTDALRVQPAGAEGLDLDWLVLSPPGSARVGLLDAEKIPRSVPVVEIAAAKPPLSEFVVCRDTRAIERVSRRYADDLKFPIALEQVDSGYHMAPSARYRVLTRPTDRRTVVFLNASRLDSRDIGFLIALFAELERLTRSGSIPFPGGLVEAVYEGDARPYRILGLPFAIVTPPTEKNARACASAAGTAWAELTALRALAASFDQATLVKFVSDRVDLFRDSLRRKRDDVLLSGTLNEFFGLYVRIAALLMVFPVNSGVLSANRRSVERAHGELVSYCKSKRVASMGEALSAMLEGLLDPALYESVAVFMGRLPAVLEEGHKKLTLEFHDSTLPLFLMKTALTLSAQLSIEPENVPEERIHQFLEMCDRLAKKAGTNLLLDVVSRRMKLQVLVALGYFVLDPIVSRQAERVATDNLARFEGRLGGYRMQPTGSRLDEGDLLLDVLTVAGLCWMIGDVEGAKRMEALVEARKDHSEAKTALAQMLWTHFAATEDYDALVQLRALLPEIKPDRVPGNVLLQPSHDMFAAFADGVLTEDRRFEHFARAQLMAAAMEPSPEVFVKDVLQQQALNAFFTMFPFLYHAAQSESVTLLSSNLRHAVEAANHFSVAERRESPNYLTYLKTAILEKMALGEVEEVSRIAQEIAGHPQASAPARQLASLAGRWVDGMVGRIDPVLSALDSNATTRSPWIQVAQRLVSSSARTHYLRVAGRGPQTDNIQRVQGVLNVWRGAALELAIQVCYLSDGYTAHRGVLMDGKEVMDVIAYRTDASRNEVVFVDAKFTRESYSSEQAAHFARRIRDLVRQRDDLFPHLIGDLHVRAVVASLSGVSEEALSVLSRELPGAEVTAYAGKALPAFLKKHSVRLPVKAAESETREAP